MPPGKKKIIIRFCTSMFTFSNTKQHETMAVKIYTTEHTVAEIERLERLQVRMCASC